MVQYSSICMSEYQQICCWNNNKIFKLCPAKGIEKLFFLGCTNATKRSRPTSTTIVTNVNPPKMKLHNRTDAIWHTFLLPLSLTSVPFTLMRDQTKVCFYKVAKISFRIFQNSIFTSKTSNIIFVKDHSYIT